MSKEQYSPIRFQLEESIWLDHRGEEAEIISLELNPSVEVSEEGDQVSISGHLLLTGRFHVEEDDEEEPLNLESSSLAEQLHFQPLRVDQKEIYEQEYRGRIEKRFPVAVTVPRYKINQLEDVYVQVDEFDYTVSDGHRLNIAADVAIIGINSEYKREEQQEEIEPEVVQQEGIQEEEVQQEVAQPEEVQQKKAQDAQDNQQRSGEQPQELDTPTFNVSATKEESGSASEPVPEPASESGPTPKPEPASESGPTPEPELNSARTEEPQESDANIEVPETDRTIERERAQREQAQPEDEQTEAESGVGEAIKEETEDDKVVSLPDREIQTHFFSLPEEGIEEAIENDQNPTNEVLSAAEGQEQDDQENKESQTASFLTQLLEGREEENEGRSDYARLKMRIIQEDESLDEIADNYSVSVHDLLSFNQLESEQVTAGQIIYIPK